jgi:hypothetical protein
MRGSAEERFPASPFVLSPRVELPAPAAGTSGRGAGPEPEFGGGHLALFLFGVKFLGWVGKGKEKGAAAHLPRKPKARKRP